MADDVMLERRRRGREAFAARRWGDAHALLAASHAALDPEERVLLATSAYLLGRDDECVRHLEDAYHRLEADGEVAWASRCAFWVGFVLLDGGELARGGGWIARGHGLLDHHGLDVVERGYLQVPIAVQLLYGGDGPGAERSFTAVAELAARFHDTDLAALARLGRGQSLILQERFDDGLALLDEAMVAVTSGEVNPVFSGIVYCAVIESCQATFDLGRAREWTDALTRWCDAQPDLVPYRGQCQIHRAQILRLHGDWKEAQAEAERARRRLSRKPGPSAVGAALYEQGELHRLRGQVQQAEEAYREASAHGHDPQPGLSWLRLAQGDVAAAVAGLRRTLDEAPARASRPRLLGACVEAELAAGELAAAAAAAEKLTAMAAEHDVAQLRALAAHARAAVHLAEDDAAAALRDARLAWEIWHGFGTPYEAARARVLVGRACQALGDHDAAQLELDAARRAFRQLGARGELASLDEAAAARTATADGGLTAREVQIVRLVARGDTNRAIAAELVISEKTVARHLSNIYTKLGVSSRAAATAWAYQHELT